MNIISILFYFSVSVTCAHAADPIIDPIGLFHVETPIRLPTRSPPLINNVPVVQINTQSPPQTQSAAAGTHSETTQINDGDNWGSDDFVPYKSARHDEFDWSMTKVHKNIPIHIIFY